MTDAVFLIGLLSLAAGLFQRYGWDVAAITIGAILILLALLSELWRPRAAE